jgi:hypothetical protein
MTKRLLILLTGVLLVFGGVASAAPTTQGVALEDLTTLGNYAPASTEFFAVVRTDDGYLDQIDALIATVTANFDQEIDLPIRAALDEIILDATFGDLNFIDDIRPALGDTAGVFVYNVQSAILTGTDNIPFVFAAEVTSQDAMTDLLDRMIELNVDISLSETILSETDTAVVYESTFTNTNYYVTSDFLFITNHDFSTQPRDNSLSASETFRGALAAMPQSEYNFLAYLNLAEVARTLGTFLQGAAGADAADLLPTGAELADGLGQQVIGGFIVDDRALVLDAVTTGVNPSPMQAPLDLSLIERVPATTPALIQGTQLGEAIRAGVDAFSQLDALLLSIDPTIYDDPALPGFARLGSLSTFIRQAFEGTFQVGFDETMDALNGDFVNYLTFDYLIDADGDQIRAGLNLLLANNNPEVTAALVDEIAEIAMQTFTPSVFEDERLLVPLGEFFSREGVLDVVVRYDEEIVVVGPAFDADFAFASDGESLAATENFSYESGLFLEGATTLLYLDLAPIRAFIIDFGEANGQILSERDRDDLTTLVNVLSVVETSSITTATAGQGVAVRATITFAEAP